MEGFARAAELLDVDQAKGFVAACGVQLNTHRHVDRSRQNLAELAIVDACVTEISTKCPLFLADVNSDEILIPADAAPIAFSNVTIGILYARSVDLRSIIWNNTAIITLFADKFTVIGDAAPSPMVVEFPEKTLRTQQATNAWRYPAILPPDAEEPAVLADDLDLLRRIDRYRPFWLREHPDTVDRSARKIITDRQWERVRQVLLDLDLIEERNVQASGPHAKFIHFRRFRGKFSENQDVISALQRG